MKRILKKMSILLALVIILSIPTSVAQAATCPPHTIRSAGTTLDWVDYSYGYHGVQMPDGSYETCTVALEYYHTRYECVYCSYYFYVSAGTKEVHTHPYCPY